MRSKENTVLGLRILVVAIVMVGTLVVVGQSIASANSVILYATSCASTTFCVTVGNADNEGDEPLIYQTSNGTTWTTDAAPAGVGELLSVACASAEICVATGYASPLGEAPDEMIATSNAGATWNKVALPAGVTAIESVSCHPGGTGACWAVGGNDSGMDILSSATGTSGWTIEHSNSNGYADTGIACVSSAVCDVTGYGFWGTNVSGSWTFTNGTEYGPYLSCATADFCLSGAYSGPSDLYILTASGTWSPLYTDSLAKEFVDEENSDACAEYSCAVVVTSVSCPTTAECVVTGTVGWSTSGPGGVELLSRNYEVVTQDSGLSWTANPSAGQVLSCPNATTCLSAGGGSSPLSYSPVVGGPLAPVEAAGGGGGAEPGSCTCLTQDVATTDLANGDYFVTDKDVSLPSLGSALVFSRTYDSLQAQAQTANNAPGPMGYGWTDNWNTHLNIGQPYAGAVTLVGPNSAEAFFIPPTAGACLTPFVGSGASGTFCSLPRVVDSLTYSASTSTYELAEPDGTTETFASTGSLVASADPHGNLTTIVSGSASEAPGTASCPTVAEVADTKSCSVIESPGERDLTIGWSGPDASGEITSVTEPMGNRWTYGYCTESSPGAGTSCLTGDLITATSPTGLLTTYTYSGAASSFDTSIGNDLTSASNPSETAAISLPSLAAFCSGPERLTAIVGYAVACYDARGRVIASADAMGLVDTYSYRYMQPSSGNGTVLYVNGDGNETEYLFNAAEVQSAEMGADLEYDWSYSQDPSSLLLTSLDNPVGVTTSWTYDSVGHVLSTTDGNHDKTTYCYNSSLSDCGDETGGLGSLYETTPPLGAATRATYDSSGNRLTTTVEGRLATPVAPTLTTARTYYPNGLLACQVQPVEVAASVNCPDTPGDWVAGVTAYTYDSSGDLTQVEDPDGDVSVYAYTSNGERYCTISAKAYGAGTHACPAYGSKQANTETSTFTAANQVLTSSNADGGVTQYSYDVPLSSSTGTVCLLALEAVGTCNVSTSPAASVSVRYFDLDGRLEAVTLGGGSKGPSTTTYGYDIAYGKLSCTTDVSAAVYCETIATGGSALAAGTTMMTEYFDDGGRLVGYTLPLGSSGALEVTSLKPGVALGTSGCSARGLPATAAYCNFESGPLGSVVSVLDGDNRVLSNTYSTVEPATQTYKYDALGQMTSMKDGTGTTSYSYDSDGRMTKSVAKVGGTDTYGWNVDNSMTCVSYPISSATACPDSGAPSSGSGFVAYSYDRADRMATEQDFLSSGDPKTTFQDDADGNLTKVTYPNGDSVTSDFDDADFETSSTLAPTAKPASPLASVTYIPTASLQSQSSTYSGDLAGKNSYVYTAVGSLSSTNGAGYSYDTNGDPTKVLMPAPVAATTEPEVQTFTTGDELATSTVNSVKTSFVDDSSGDRIKSSPASMHGPTSYTYNQLGELTSVSTAPLQARAISTSGEHSLAVQADGKVYAWGENNDDQLGESSATASHLDTPNPVSGLSSIVSVAAGDGFSVALGSAGHVFTWGSDATGQLGNGKKGANDNSPTPTEVAGLTDIASIAAGSNFAVALSKTGTVWEWGAGADGNLGNGSDVAELKPVEVKNLTDAVSVSAGADDVLAVRSTGGVESWGENATGELGNGTTSNEDEPVQVSSLTAGISSVAAGGYFSLALSKTGSLYSWGDNSHGELALGTTTSETKPTATGLDFSAVSAGGRQAIGIMPSGAVETWGYNNSGQLGTGTTTDAHTPVRLSQLDGAHVSTGGSSAGECTLVLSRDGTVVGMGGDGDGQVGSGVVQSSVRVPVAVDYEAAPAASYEYNGLGQRVLKTTQAGAAVSSWFGRELLGTGPTMFIYGPDGNVIVQTASGSTSPEYLFSDHLGSTLALTSSSGTLNATYTYTDFGAIEGETGEAVTAIGFVGGYTDSETNLVYSGGRYYDPLTAQYMTASNGLQPFEFAADDPVSAPQASLAPA